MKRILALALLLTIPLVGQPKKETLTLTIQNKTKDAVIVYVQKKYGKELEAINKKFEPQIIPMLDEVEELMVQSEKEEKNFVKLEPGKSLKIPTHEGRYDLFRYLPLQPGCHASRLRMPFVVPYKGKDSFAQYCRINGPDLTNGVYHITAKAPTTASRSEANAVPSEITVINDTKQVIPVAFRKTDQEIEQVRKKQDDNPQLKSYYQQIDKIKQEIEKEARQALTLQPGQQTTVTVTPFGKIFYTHRSCKRKELENIESDIKRMEEHNRMKKYKYPDSMIRAEREKYTKVQQDTSDQYNTCEFIGADFADTNNTLVITD